MGDAMMIPTAAAFAADGPLAAVVPGYAPRLQQIEFAESVGRALARGRDLVAECPAGVGKSLGYGVPAARHAVLEGARVVVATANIALQEQLVGKDLPLLADALPWPFSFALVKGRGNYLCQSAIARELEQGTFELADRPEDFEQRRAIAYWSRETATGDVAELPFIPEVRVWAGFSSSGEDCKGGDCKHRSSCYAERARSRAEAADVVVCNYHLLFAHVIVRERTGGEDLVLPPHDVVVMDEAHRAADIARDFLGFRITAWTFRRAAALLGRLGDRALRDAVVGEGATLMDRLLEYRRSPDYRARLRRPDPVSWASVDRELVLAQDRYAAEAAKAPTADARAEIRVVADRVDQLRARLADAMEARDDGQVYFIEEDAKGRASLCSKAVDVSDRLGEWLFGRTKTTVMTSATLAVDGSLDHVIGELGVADPMELIVGTPFDFKTQAMLVLPSGLPDPTSRDFSEGVAELVARIVELADGRTLALFTSYRCLRAAAERLVGSSRRVLVQGTAPRTALVEEFRRDVGSVLLGTDSFWAGVDVPGEALSCVVIDRLPFPTPNDPVLDAVKSRNGGRGRWFQEYSIPRAVTAFRQGFGRLIRSVDDRGVVIALDRRLVDKPYGAAFLRSLPNTRVTRELGEVAEFLGPSGTTNP